VLSLLDETPRHGRSQGRPDPGALSKVAGGGPGSRCIAAVLFPPERRHGSLRRKAPSRAGTFFRGGRRRTHHPLRIRQRQGAGSLSYGHPRRPPGRQTGGRRESGHERRQSLRSEDGHP
jgi:hypothetical protein